MTPSTISTAEVPRSLPTLRWRASAFWQLHEPLKRELPDRLEQPEPSVRKPHEALLDECLECVELGLDDLLRCLERAAAGEDGEPREQMLLLVGEQVDAPFDRRPQR